MLDGVFFIDDFISDANRARGSVIISGMRAIKPLLLVPLVSVQSLL